MSIKAKVTKIFFFRFVRDTNIVIHVCCLRLFLIFHGCSMLLTINDHFIIHYSLCNTKTFSPYYTLTHYAHYTLWQLYITLLVILKDKTILELGTYMYTQNYFVIKSIKPKASLKIATWLFEIREKNHHQ